MKNLFKVFLIGFTLNSCTPFNISDDCRDELNRYVNFEGKYEEQPNEGVIFSNYNVLDKAGDCEDFATTKVLFLKKYCPNYSSAYLLTFYSNLHNIGHAVLVVDGQVLDNRSLFTYPLNDLEIKYQPSIKRKYDIHTEKLLTP